MYSYDRRKTAHADPHATAELQHVTKMLEAVFLKCQNIKEPVQRWETYKVFEAWAKKEIKDTLKHIEDRMADIDAELREQDMQDHDHGHSEKWAAAAEDTYGGHDIAKMHDELHHRHKALIKGIHVEVKQTPGRRGGKYDKFELLINNKKVWDGEAASIDPLNIAGGTIEAFVLHALDQAGIKREKH